MFKRTCNNSYYKQHILRVKYVVVDGGKAFYFHVMEDIQ